MKLFFISFILVLSSCIYESQYPVYHQSEHQINPCHSIQYKLVHPLILYIDRSFSEIQKSLIKRGGKELNREISLATNGRLYPAFQFTEDFREIHNGEIFPSDLYEFARLRGDIINGLTSRKYNKIIVEIDYMFLGKTEESFLRGWLNMSLYTLFIQTNMILITLTS